MNSTDYLTQRSKILSENPSSPTPLLSSLFQQACQFENNDRELFSRHRDGWEIIGERSDLSTHPHPSLIPAYDGTTGEPIPGAFTPEPSSLDRDAKRFVFPASLKSSTSSNKNNNIVIQPNLNTFKSTFLDIFAEGQLQFLNWNNVFCAGGSVLACLQPVSSEFRDVAPRKYFHDIAYAGSDVDLFLYGLTEQQAKDKLVEIYEAVCRANPFEVVAFRSAHAITLVSQYPFRHIQIVLRIYSSPYEVLAGFDVDACTVGFDGTNVYCDVRSHHALVTNYNTIDFTRRSPSYEMRLAKYGMRGFSVLVPGLDRDKVDPGIFERPWNSLDGLAKLLVLEKLRTPEERAAFYDAQRELRGTSNTAHYHSFSSRFGGGFGFGSSSRYARSQGRGAQERMQEAAGTSSAEMSNYSTVFLPWGPGLNAITCMTLMAKKDRLLNNKWFSRDRSYRLHPCFFGTMEEVLSDMCPDDPPFPTDFSEEALAKNPNLKNHRDTHVRGELKFMVDDPGRQRIGSFTPLDEAGWASSVYFLPESEALFSAVNANDPSRVVSVLEELKNIAIKLGGDPLTVVDKRDFFGRTALHLAVMVGAIDVVKVLLQAGANPLENLAGSRNVFHLAAVNDRSDIVPLLAAAVKAKKASAAIAKTTTTTTTASTSNEIPTLETVINNKDESEFTPFHCAAALGHVNTCRKLLESGAKPHLPYLTLSPAFLFPDAVVDVGIKDMVEFGWSSIKLISEDDSSLMTALHQACNRVSGALLRAIIKYDPTSLKGINMLRMPIYRTSPLAHAIDAKSVECVRALVETGLCEFKLTKSSVQRAMEKNLELMNKRGQNTSRYSRYSFMAYNNNPVTDLTAFDDDGTSELHHAVQNTMTLFFNHYHNFVDDEFDVMNRHHRRHRHHYFHWNSGSRRSEMSFTDLKRSLERQLISGLSSSANTFSSSPDEEETGENSFEAMLQRSLEIIKLITAAMPDEPTKPIQPVPQPQSQQQPHYNRYGNIGRPTPWIQGIVTNPLVLSLLAGENASCIQVIKAIFNRSEMLTEKAKEPSTWKSPAWPEGIEPRWGDLFGNSESESAQASVRILNEMITELEPNSNTSGVSHLIMVLKFWLADAQASLEITAGNDSKSTTSAVGRIATTTTTVGNKKKSPSDLSSEEIIVIFREFRQQLLNVLGNPPPTVPGSNPKAEMDAAQFKLAASQITKTLAAQQSTLSMGGSGGGGFGFGGGGAFAFGGGSTLPTVTDPQKVEAILDRTITQPDPAVESPITSTHPIATYISNLEKRIGPESAAVREYIAYVGGLSFWCYPNSYSTQLNVLTENDLLFTDTGANNGLVPLPANLVFAAMRLFDAAQRGDVAEITTAAAVTVNGIMLPLTIRDAAGQTPFSLAVLSGNVAAVKEVMRLARLKYTSLKTKVKKDPPPQRINNLDLIEDEEEEDDDDEGGDEDDDEGDDEDDDEGDDEEEEEQDDEDDDDDEKPKSKHKPGKQKPEKDNKSASLCASPLVLLNESVFLPINNNSVTGQQLPTWMKEQINETITTITQHAAVIKGSDRKIEQGGNWKLVELRGIHIAVLSGNVAMVQAILDEAEMESISAMLLLASESKLGPSALEMAIAIDRVDIVNVFLSRGVGLIDNDGGISLERLLRVRGAISLADAEARAKSGTTATTGDDNTTTQTTTRIKTTSRRSTGGGGGRGAWANDKVWFGYSGIQSSLFGAKKAREQDTKNPALKAVSIAPRPTFTLLLLAIKWGSIHCYKEFSLGVQGTPGKTLTTFLQGNGPAQTHINDIITHARERTPRIFNPLNESTNNFIIRLFVTGKVDVYGRGEVHYALLGNSVQRLSDGGIMLDASRPSVPVIQGGGDLPLSLAVQISNVETIEELIMKWNAPILVHDVKHSGNTPLHLALTFSRYRVVEKLLRLAQTKGLNITDLLSAKNNMGITPVMIAVNQGTFGALKPLVESLSAQLPVTDREGMGKTLLHLAANARFTETLSLLVQVLKNINGTSKFAGLEDFVIGATPLDEARAQTILMQNSATQPIRMHLLSTDSNSTRDVKLEQIDRQKMYQNKLVHVLQESFPETHRERASFNEVRNAKLAHLDRVSKSFQTALAGDGSSSRSNSSSVLLLTSANDVEEAKAYFEAFAPGWNWANSEAPLTHGYQTCEFRDAFDVIHGKIVTAAIFSHPGTSIVEKIAFKAKTKDERQQQQPLLSSLAGSMTSLQQLSTDSFRSSLAAAGLSAAAELLTGNNISNLFSSASAVPISLPVAGGGGGQFIIPTITEPATKKAAVVNVDHGFDDGDGDDNDDDEAGEEGEDEEFDE
jgi:ankyrin repeat protein